MVGCVILDLDGTLYVNERLRQEYGKALLEFVSERCGVEPETVMRLHREVGEVFGDVLGRVPGTVALLPVLGISLQEWFDYCAQRVSPDQFVETDADLARALSYVRAAGVKVAVVTNSGKVLARRTLDGLGVSELVDVVVAPQVADDLKPGLRMYVRVLEDLRVEAGSCVVVGDRDGIDLEPGRRLGMRVRLVTGPEDVIRVLNDMVAGARMVNHE